jgi:hypothetical protein
VNVSITRKKRWYTNATEMKRGNFLGERLIEGKIAVHMLPKKLLRNK